MRLRAVCLLLLLAAALAAVPGARAGEPRPARKLKGLLVIGGCCHDYAKQQELTRGLAARVPSEWTVAYDKDTSRNHLNPLYEKEGWARGFDVVIHDECSPDVKDLAAIERILAPHRAGLPAVLLHCAMHSYRSEGHPNAVTPWFEFAGLQSTGHGPEAPIEVVYTNTEHPITRGLEGWRTGPEELYNNLTGRLLPGATELARGRQVVGDRTDEAIVAWTHRYRNRARVFATTLGHNNATVADPRYLDFVARGLRWAVERE